MLPWSNSKQASPHSIHTPTTPCPRGSPPSSMPFHHQWWWQNHHLLASPPFWCQILAPGPLAAVSCPIVTPNSNSSTLSHFTSHNTHMTFSRMGFLIQLNTQGRDQQGKDHHKWSSGKALRWAVMKERSLVRSFSSREKKDTIELSESDH